MQNLSPVYTTTNPPEKWSPRALPPFFSPSYAPLNQQLLSPYFLELNMKEILYFKVEEEKLV